MIGLPAGTTIWLAAGITDMRTGMNGLAAKVALAEDPYLCGASHNVGFNALYEGGGIDEAACWTHTRRNFHDLHVARPSPLTTEALRRIAELYLIEAEIRSKPPDERWSVRQARATVA
jgi:transposase